MLASTIIPLLSASASSLLAPSAVGTADVSVLDSVSVAPDVISGFGGPWYSDTVPGDCGSSTISGMPDGSPGGWKAYASIDSTVGTIIYGEVKMTWGGSGGSGIFLFNVSGEYWTSTTVDGRVSPGSSVGLVLSGTVTVVGPGGEYECTIEEPAISFKTQP